MLGHAVGTNWVDRWVKAELELGIDARRQALFRQWRALHSFQEDTGRVLIGLPVVTLQELSHSHLITLQNELGLVFSYLTRDTTHQVELSAFPLAEKDLFEAPARDLMIAIQEDSFWLPLELTSLTGCDIWLARIESPNPTEALGYFTNREGPQARYLRASLLRIEALLEDRGAGVRLGPPQALWNAGSFARLGYARHVLGALHRDCPLLSCEVSEKPVHTWELSDQTGRSKGALYFREETVEDVAPLRKWVRQFRSG